MVWDGGIWLGVFGGISSVVKVVHDYLKYRLNVLLSRKHANSLKALTILLGKTFAGVVSGRRGREGGDGG